MSVLFQIADAVEAYNRFVKQQVVRARNDPQFRDQILQRWQAARAGVGIVTTPTGLKLPRLALPQTDEPGEIARYLFGEGLPGEFPFMNAAYRQMYLQVAGVAAGPNRKSPIGNVESEEPTRLFAGLGVAEDTNQRF